MEIALAFIVVGSVSALGILIVALVFVFGFYRHLAIVVRLSIHCPPLDCWCRALVLAILLSSLLVQTAFHLH